MIICLCHVCRFVRALRLYSLEKINKSSTNNSIPAFHVHFFIINKSILIFANTYKQKFHAIFNKQKCYFILKTINLISFENTFVYHVCCQHLIILSNSCTPPAIQESSAERESLKYKCNIGSSNTKDIKERC